MPELLKKRLFRPSDIKLSAVRNFDCGNELWEKEVSDWIQGKPGGVLDDLARTGGCQVWLYRTQANYLVGFGSLSEPAWGYPKGKDPHPNLIPMLGLNRRFWGMPTGPKNERYAAQIMDDIIEEARLHTERAPVLILYVHPQNLRAIRFYESTGFVPYHRIWTDDKTGVVYQTMRLNL